MGFDSRQGQEIFLFSIASRPAKEPCQPAVYLMSGICRLGLKPKGVKLITRRLCGYLWLALPLFELHREGFILRKLTVAQLVRKFFLVFYET
jgi:hypothetical protein